MSTVFTPFPLLPLHILTPLMSPHFFIFYKYYCYIHNLLVLISVALTYMCLGLTDWDWVTYLGPHP